MHTKNRMISFLMTFLAALVILPVAMPSSAWAIPRPERPTERAARTPDLLTAYERRTLRIEMKRLTKAISEARRKAGEHEEVLPLREKAEALKKSTAAPEEVRAAERVYSDMREVKLYEMPGIPEKIKRLGEVGFLLEYDTRARKEQRASAPEVITNPSKE